MYHCLHNCVLSEAARAENKSPERWWTASRFTSTAPCLAPSSTVWRDHRSGPSPSRCSHFSHPTSRLLTGWLPQYEDVLESKSGSNKSPSDVYGAEHLLRLFVKLPTLLSYTQMEADQASMLQKNLAEFIR